MTEQPQDRAARIGRRFDTLFAEYFDTLGTALDAPSFSRFTPDCVGLLRDLSLRGGKRMRVVLLHEAARLVRDDTPSEALDAAALSVELLQTHGLVHDDLIDDSATRRGGPTTYYAYRERFPEDPRAALGLTVLAGDLALALSLRVLLDSGLPVGMRQAMVEVQTRAAADTFVGQIVDLERDFADPVPDVEVLHDVADRKSARYSVLAPMRLGLLAAGVEPGAHEDELRRYARLVGVCGQMRDDWLDLFGTEETTGKPTGGDIREGRRSYAVTRLLTAVAGPERATIEAALGDRSCPPDTIAEIRDIGERHGVAALLEADMRLHADRARLVAEGWHGRWRAEAVDFFERLPRWSVERTG
ncbi:polyprenyl synthetase family protein [Streptomyces mutabilis]|uniref:polyprenyl synthetase family protein n=1 Tax=Streptomyces mutabilis TaxID=67332 RepID=UPI0033B863E2